MYTIVEGFDKVGKTTFIQGGKGGKGTKLNKLSNQFGHTSMEGQYGIGYPQSWVIGAAMIHLVRQANIQEDIVVDRGILSSLVYGEIQENFMGYEYIMTKLLDDMKAINAKVIYLRHADKGSANLKYQASLSRDIDANDEYDHFEGFEAYWDKYLDMDNRFMRWIDALRLEGLDIEVRDLVALDFDKCPLGCV